MHKLTKPVSLLALAGSLGLAGCIVVPAGRPYAAYDGDVVAVAPPALQAEVAIAPPGPGYFWIGGFWNWSGGRHLWQPGHWQAQRPGYRWQPQYWQRDGRGWRSAPGHWRRG